MLNLLLWSQLEQLYTRSGKFARVQEQIDKTRAKEELLRRVDAGEDAAQVIAELGLKLKPRSLWKVRQAYRQRGWEGLVDHRCGYAYKAIAEVCQLLDQAKKEDTDRTGTDLATMVELKCGVNLSVGRVNDLLREMNLSSPPGRRGPGKAVPNTNAAVIDRAGFFPSRLLWSRWRRWAVYQR